MNKCVGIINLDENEKKMNELVKSRTLAAVPFAGRYRIIDFILSNMTNSGIDTIGLFTKNKSRSLLEHLSNGRPWDLHRKKGGLKVFNFGDIDPFYEDINNFSENMEFLHHSSCEYVLLAPSYMICNIDFNKAIEAHRESNNDITLIYKTVKNEEKYRNCQMIKKDSEGRITAIRKRSSHKSEIDVSMEMYIMKKELFIRIVEESARTGLYKKVKEYIQSNIEELIVGGYEFKGYLACINSVNNYYDANMDLLNQDINKELFSSEDRMIYTKVKDEPPTQYAGNAKVENSMIANGCYIEGTVKNSLIFRKVIVGQGVELNNCIVMQNTIIEKNAKLINVIVDKGRIVMENEDCSGTVALPLVI